MVIFVGMIWALPKISFEKRLLGTVVTVIPVYILNLLRNAMVVFLVGNDITSFFMAHNVLSKIGSLIALVVLLFIIIKIIPEIFDEIICLTDIYKRNGPIEKMVGKLWSKK
jgi:exosortase/archaeosortase family protein